jgi:hypothetical protein
VQLIINFLQYLSAQYHNLIANETPLTILSFWLGIVSLIVGIVAAVYAERSARKGEALLKRLIVYPFREFDLAISNLTEMQQEELIRLFIMSKGKEWFKLDRATSELGDFARPSLNLLLEKGWLIQESNGETKYRINPDRRGYLTFFIEANEEPKD